jgi:hypothetical protein
LYFFCDEPGRRRQNSTRHPAALCLHRSGGSSTTRAAVCAGGSAAANEGANPQPQLAGSQDNGHGKLVLPHSSQRRLKQQLTKHWHQFKALRQHYASTNFEEQRQLHLPQKHKATVPESSMRVKMNALEEQADNAKARDLYWKPLSWLGTTGSANDAPLHLALRSANSTAIGNNTLTIRTFLFSSPLSAQAHACTASFCVFFFYRPTGRPRRASMECHRTVTNRTRFDSSARHSTSR